ncbi:AzlD domain-containing protein [Vibrio pectenicida]|uniref:AzlD domain-containing protein n=1 Tax=Vibrio pectenicida TaxID=62763 RepID=A0A3R9EG34_9VIBR|nr:AzlD domain-containing protein [Vibrio pectenicida]RSD30869.1 AzlD domain-containing protein [Vibrio pectenicida]
MTLNTDWVIFLMALITFACRYLFFMRSIPISLSSKTKQLLRYTAPSVLTAMWVPIVFLEHGTSFYNLYTSPFFYAGVITVLLSLKCNNTLMIVAGGMLAFSIFNWLVI